MEAVVFEKFVERSDKGRRAEEHLDLFGLVDLLFEQQYPHNVRNADHIVVPFELLLAYLFRKLKDRFFRIEIGDREYGVVAYRVVQKFLYGDQMLIGKVDHIVSFAIEFNPIVVTRNLTA